MASPEAEAIAKRLERAFAYDQWDTFWAHLKELYDQGLRDGGAAPAGTPVPSLPADAPPRPEKVKASLAAQPVKCSACGGAGERSISLPPQPGSPVAFGRSVIGPCPDCGGTGGGAPPRAEAAADNPSMTFTGGGETTRDAAALPQAVPPAMLRPPAPVAAGANGRYALVGDAVVDKTEKKVAYRGADAATVYEALRAG